MNSYTFRANCIYDVIKLIPLIDSNDKLITSSIEPELPAQEVQLTTNMTKDQIAARMTELIGSYIMIKTLKSSEEYTSERVSRRRL